MCIFQPGPRRGIARRLTFGLRTWFALVALAALLCATLRDPMGAIWRQSVAVAAIEAAGGQVILDDGALGWLDVLAGPQCVRAVRGVVLRRDGSASDDGRLAEIRDALEALRVTSLDIRSCRVSDDGLRQIVNVTSLRELYATATQVTGDGLRHLRQLERLEVLALGETQVDDAGVEHLHHLRRLNSLALDGTRVTGRSLPGLATLPELRHLRWAGNHVSSEDVRQLQRFPALTELGLEGPAIGDDHLRRLADLPRLKTLSLQGTGATDEGLDWLRTHSQVRQFHVAPRLSALSTTARTPQAIDAGA